MDTTHLQVCLKVNSNRPPERKPLIGAGYIVVPSPSHNWLVIDGPTANSNDVRSPSVCIKIYLCWHTTTYGAAQLDSHSGTEYVPFMPALMPALR